MLTLEKLKARVVNSTLGFQLLRLAGLNFSGGRFTPLPLGQGSPVSPQTLGQTFALEAMLSDSVVQKVVPGGSLLGIPF